MKTIKEIKTFDTEITCENTIVGTLIIDCDNEAYLHYVNAFSNVIPDYDDCECEIKLLIMLAYNYCYKKGYILQMY